MHWLHDFQLFLFDFDGLLVNTEEIHFQAYKNMCEKYGFNLNWSFDRYCRAAHYRAEGLKEEIYQAIPELYQAEPRWEVLYSYKKKQVIHLLESGAIQLMPGVYDLLQTLQDSEVKRCVVTHSPQAFTWMLSGLNIPFLTQYLTGLHANIILTPSLILKAIN